jgi:hypothetical protein
MDLVFRYFDERAVFFLGMVCKRWRAFAVQVLRRFKPQLRAYGSAVQQLKPIILDQLMSGRTLHLAVDQFPYDDRDESILRCILDRGLNLTLALGTRDDRLLGALERAKVRYIEEARRKGSALVKVEASAVTSFHKMHNKFWVIDGEGVITGSPNVSFAGLSKNIESFILIKSPRVADLFVQYLRLLKSPTPTSGPKFAELKSQLVTYNSEDHRLKLAMAPLINISDFVVENLEGATKIVIRQFLVSPKKNASDPGTDILQALCVMASKGVEIEVYIDDAMYESQRFVQTACDTLIGAGCQVFTQKAVYVLKEDEFCIHDKLILATIWDGVAKKNVNRAMIGSAGFTIDVIANKNAENFLSVDSDSVYDSLLAHHLAAVSSDRVQVNQISRARYQRRGKWYYSLAKQPAGS